MQPSVRILAQPRSVTRHWLRAATAGCTRPTPTELDAIYYMVSNVFGFEIRFIERSLCGYPHLDKDWFAVHPHRRHLCAGCGHHFRDNATGIGNPIAELQRATGLVTREPVPAGRSLTISQSDYPGGIQILGLKPGDHLVGCEG